MKNRKLRIEMSSSFHHGSGFGIAGIVDRAALRDSRGVPYLAGSSIKGKLRHAALRVILSEGHTACYRGDETEWCLAAQPCSLCHMFGSPRQKGRLIFVDAYPIGGTEEFLEQLGKLRKPGGLYRDSQLRSRTAMDRVLGTVQPQALFVTEVLPESLVFEGRIIGPLENQERTLLEKACRIVTHFGADSARGLGRCQFSLQQEMAE